MLAFCSQPDVSLGVVLLTTLLIFMLFHQSQTGQGTQLNTTSERQSIYLIVQMLVWRKFRDMGMRRKLRSLVLSFCSDHLPLQSCRLKVSVWIHWTIWGSCHVSDCSEGVRLFLAEQTSVVASIQKLENQAEILSVKFHLQGKRHYQGQSK